LGLDRTRVLQLRRVPQRTRFELRRPCLWFLENSRPVRRSKVDVLFPRTGKAKPRFTLFPTISTHFPFHQVPPYQPDWNTLLNSKTPFDPDLAAKAQAEQVNWENMKPDYLRAINYAHTWLAGYFKQPEPRETVYVMIGDHQPTGSVSRQEMPWDVPVFVVSKDNRLLDRFRAMGFTNGMTPKQRAPLGGLHDLTATLLTGFGPQPSSTRFAQTNKTPLEN